VPSNLNPNCSQNQGRPQGRPSTATIRPRELTRLCTGATGGTAASRPQTARNTTTKAPEVVPTKARYHKPELPKNLRMAPNTMPHIEHAPWQLRTADKNASKTLQALACRPTHHMAARTDDRRSQNLDTFDGDEYRRVWFPSTKEPNKYKTKVPDPKIGVKKSFSSPLLGKPVIDNKSSNPRSAKRVWYADDS